MNALVNVTLPVGLRGAGVQQGQWSVRPLRGVDELLVQESVAVHRSNADLTSALLASCTTCSDEHTTTDMVDALCVGDREALLLHLWRLTFSEVIDAVVACPECAQVLDLSLHTSELLLAPAEDAAAENDIELDFAGERWQARLRRVNGADQRAVANTPEPARTLLRRCVLSVNRANSDSVPAEEIPDGLSTALDYALATLDPQAEIRLDVACEACGSRFSAPFDAASHLLAQLAAETEAMLSEVALLAHSLHWSEADILRLPRQRRRAYAARLSS